MVLRFRTSWISSEIDFINVRTSSSNPDCLDSRAKMCSSRAETFSDIRLHESQLTLASSFNKFGGVSDRVNLDEFLWKSNVLAENESETGAICFSSKLEVRVDKLDPRV